MSFNSQSYYRNKAKRQAGEDLATARKAKAIGNENGVIFYARSARSHWRQYLMYRKLDIMDADLKLRLSGKMSHQDFMSKYGPLP